MLTFVKVQNKRSISQAIQVSIENMGEVAKWCGGEVVPRSSNSRVHIAVPVAQRGGAPTINAYSGMWVVNTERGFKVYTQKQYRSVFQEVPDQMEQYAKVHEIVMAALSKQDAITYHEGASSETVALAKKTTQALLSVIN